MSEEMKAVIPTVDTPVITMKKLLEAGVHFGHQTRRWNPKMKKYIYTARNGIYIIDLAKTAAMITAAYKALKEIVDNGGKVLFVGTKKQCQEIMKEEALRSGSFYATNRWLGGTLTNFKTIQKRIKYLKDIEKMAEDGTFNVLPKKEVAQFLKEQAKLEKVLGGIKEMRKLPNAIFVVDPRVELNAVLEARRLKIPVFGIVDTNSDPDLVDFIIPGNDDANKSVKLIASVVADAVVESKGGQPVIAYTKDEGNEVSMNDAIANVDKVEEAKRLARQQAHEEYRSRQFDRNRTGDRPNDRGGERRPYNPDRPRTPRPPYTPRPTTVAPTTPVTTPVVAEKVEVKVKKEGE